MFVADAIDRRYSVIYPSDGLAARAAALFSRSNNSLALWQKEIEIRLSSHPVPPDLRARIVKILDLPHGSNPRSPSKSSLSVSASRGVAFCEILSHPTKPTRNAHLMPHKKKKQHHLIVLSFPSTALTRTNNNNRPHVRNPEDFVEGRELHLWEPWQEVTIGGHSLPEEKEGPDFSIAPFPLLPSPFPFSPSPARTPVAIDVPIADIALLCSRFRILRERT